MKRTLVPQKNQSYLYRALSNGSVFEMIISSKGKSIQHAGDVNLALKDTLALRPRPNVSEPHKIHPIARALLQLRGGK